MDRAVIDSPVGRLRLCADDMGVCEVERTQEPLLMPETPLLRQCEAQLREYFAGTRTAFDLPLHISGTPFREKVWRALLTIPYGETRSYSELARMIGQPTASRAVGGANHHNRLCILIPCHRVIGADGSLTGYGGGVDMKEWLLRHERRT